MHHPTLKRLNKFFEYFQTLIACPTNVACSEHDCTSLLYVHKMHKYSIIIF